MTGGGEVLLLLTSGEGGVPHVCLLSPREVEREATEVRLVTRSRRTRQHLAERGTALLVLVEAGAVRKLTLRVARALDGAYALSIEGEETDALPGVVVHPMTYEVEADDPEAQFADETAALLARLRPGTAAGMAHLDRSRAASTPEEREAHLRAAREVFVRIGREDLLHLVDVFGGD